MKTYLLLALAAASLTATSCKKDNTDPDGLVAATQEGKNTGDFLLNGQPFSPRSRVTAPGDTPVGATWGHSSRGVSNVQISFSREDDNRKTRLFNIYIGSIRQLGTYQLVELISPVVAPGIRSFAKYTLPYTTSSYKPQYITGPTSPGEVIITRFDTVARVVSGTFEGKLREYQGPDSVLITKGRFDCAF